MTKGWLLLLKMLLLPAFCTIVLGFPPFKPVSNGAVFGFMRLLMLLRLRSGDPPLMGKKLLLVLEKGMPLISVFAMIPVTTLADGLDAPKMSCMKNDNVESRGGPTGPASVPEFVIVGDVLGSILVVVVVVVATLVGFVSGDPLLIGVATSSIGGATSAIGGVTSSIGDATSSTGGCVSSVGTVVVGIWPLGNVLMVVTGGVARLDSSSGVSAMTCG